jgi:hypothetical protein
MLLLLLMMMMLLLPRSLNLPVRQRRLACGCIVQPFLRALLLAPLLPLAKPLLLVRSSRRPLLLLQLLLYCARVLEPTRVARRHKHALHGLVKRIRASLQEGDASLDGVVREPIACAASVCRPAIPRHRAGGAERKLWRYARWQGGRVSRRW